MEEEQMVDILKKLNLEALKGKFISEKITPGTILKLSLTELKVLGVTDANDIRKLKFDVLFTVEILFKEVLVTSLGPQSFFCQKVCLKTS